MRIRAGSCRPGTRRCTGDERGPGGAVGAFKKTHIVWPVLTNVTAHPDVSRSTAAFGMRASSASAQPLTQTIPWMPMLQRAANTEPKPNPDSPLADHQPRPTADPFAFRLAVMTLQTESSHRSTTTDETCHPQLHHCSAA